MRRSPRYRGMRAEWCTCAAQLTWICCPEWESTPKSRVGDANLDQLADGSHGVGFLLHSPTAFASLSSEAHLQVTPIQRPFCLLQCTLGMVDF